MMNIRRKRAERNDLENHYHLDVLFCKELADPNSTLH